MRYLHLLFVPILSYTQISISTTNLPKELEETSGLEFYGENYITHNDSGDKAKVYVFNSKGKIVIIFAFSKLLIVFFFENLFIRKP